MTDGIVKTSQWGTVTLSTSSSARSRAIICLLAIFLVGKLVLLIVLSLNSTFIMDEFTHFADARVALGDLYRSNWPPKPMLYGAYP